MKCLRFVLFLLTRWILDGKLLLVCSCLIGYVYPENRAWSIYLNGNKENYNNGNGFRSRVERRNGFVFSSFVRVYVLPTFTIIWIAEKRRTRAIFFGNLRLFRFIWFINLESIRLLTFQANEWCVWNSMRHQQAYRALFSGASACNLH